MRYFTASSRLFDSIRTMVMELLQQPNDRAAQPWDAGISVLALCPHEYEPPEYQALITYALANGAHEITEAEYRQLLPPNPEP